jgi:hypothetical protein
MIMSMDFFDELMTPEGLLPHVTYVIPSRSSVWPVRTSVWPLRTNDTHDQSVLIMSPKVTKFDHLCVSTSIRYYSSNGSIAGASQLILWYIQFDEPIAVKSDLFIGFLVEKKNVAISTITPVKRSKNGHVIKSFQSRSDPTKTYEVMKYDDGSHSCNCPGWVYRRSCRHIKEITP